MENSAVRTSPTVYKKLVGVGMVFLGAVCFSAKAILVKLAYQYNVDAVSLLSLRMLFSLPFFMGIALWNNQKQHTTNQNLTQKDWGLVLLLGMIGYYVSSILDFAGLQYVTAGMERLILFVYPTMVVVVSAFLFRKAINKTQYTALALTYIGIYVAFANDVHFGAQGNFMLGATLIFISAFTYALYLIGSGALIPKIGSVRYTSYAMSFAAVGVLLHFVVVHDLGSLFYLEPTVYKLSLLMALLSTVIPSFLISKGIGMIGSGNASIVASVGPVSTIILAYIFLNESISMSQVAGTVFVLAGVLMISLQKEKEHL